jgi:hypothetical protein
LRPSEAVTPPPPSRPGAKPPLAVYTIVDKPGGDRSFWTRVGAAWINRDQSINVQLDALPVNGKLQIREAVDRPRDGERAEKRGSDSAGARTF